jgi:hypothetical protein
MEQALADALGVPLPVARAFVKHQRLDGVETPEGLFGAHEVDVKDFLARNHPAAD